MVVRKKKVKINGKEIEIDAFDTSLIPGSGTEEEAIDRLLEEEKIENEINDILLKIDSVASEYRSKDKDIWFYYKIGQVLQFVDDKGFTKQRNLIWERIADNLRPEVFFGKKTPPKKSKRYPEIMYLLAKQNYQDIPRVSWSHWFEILQYPKIYKNKNILEDLLQECKNKKLSSEQLRKRVQEINRTL
ncbi:MAG: hypothetical protein ISS41_09635 [Candidatus Aminicenantes bacterium]|nr:hypothetical protein [Candidatus Aminicenantes bacterium]